MTKQRLAKLLAQAGIASRRKCEEIISEGKVTVNGKVAELPQTMVDWSDRIEVNGERVKEEKKIYYILNKPKGYVCSNLRTGSSKLVIDLFGEDTERLFTIGRLDKATTGLLLVTNDGSFANQVMHPSSNINKEYIAKTNREITPEHLKKIASGTMVEGKFVKPVKVTKVRKGTVRVVVSDGRKHEVRLLIRDANLKVMELRRVRIGGLTLGTLPAGHYRKLTEGERRAIFD